MSIIKSIVAGQDSSFWDLIQDVSAEQRFLEKSVISREYSQPLTVTGKVQGREYNRVSI